jgi:hypothetical protein
LLAVADAAVRAGLGGAVSVERSGSWPCFAVVRGAVSTIVGVSSFMCDLGGFHGMTGATRGGNPAFAPYKRAR